MNEIPRGPDLLREGRIDRQLPHIPLWTAVVVAFIFVFSGLLIGALLPDLIKVSSAEARSDDIRDGLHSIISSSIDRFDVNGTFYVDIPVPTAFEVMFSEVDRGDYSTITDAPLGKMMEYLFGNLTGSKLTVIPGQGWDKDPGDYNLEIGTIGIDPDFRVMEEITVGLDDKEETIVFQLSVWGVEEI